jgi:hypothetical protein
LFFVPISSNSPVDVGVVGVVTGSGSARLKVKRGKKDFANKLGVRCNIVNGVASAGLKTAP